MVVLTVVLLTPSAASAEWQVKPFLGVTFAGSTTLVDLEGAVGSANVAVGISALLIGDLLGVEADLGYAPGFFKSVSSGATIAPADDPRPALASAASADFAALPSGDAE